MVFDEDVDGGFEIDGMFAAFFVEAFDLFFVPCVLELEDFAREVKGAFDADAAVGECADGIEEHLLFWGVVEIGSVSVWEDEFDLSEGVVFAGFLSEDSSAAFWGVVFKVGFFDPFGIFVEFFLELVDFDARRDVPVWVEDEVGEF